MNRKKTANRSFSAGFTLLEVLFAAMLIGLAIVALAVGSGAFTLNNAAGLDLSTAEFLIEEIRELTAPVPVIEMYRRNLQRNYVLLLLVAAGAEKDPQGASNAIESRNVDSSPLSMQAHHLSGQRAANSPLSEVAQQYRKDGHPSEFRAALRLGAMDLHSKIDAAIGRVKHPATLALLRELKVLLERVP